MRSNDTTVAEILKSIDTGKTQLPDFQRGWVWDDRRIKALIASIANSFPVGALMFLEYGNDSIHFQKRLFEGVDESAVNVIPDNLVLDGQQRLTSMYTALYNRKPVHTQSEQKKQLLRFYYLDIQKCLEPDIDMEEAVLSVPDDRKIKTDIGRTIVLDLSTQEKEFEHHVFPLNIVFDSIACSTWRNAYQKYHGYSAVILARYAIFEAKVLIPIMGYKVPVISLDKDTPKEAVCQVFENVNTGGVSLSVFELMTATFATNDFKLREDWGKRAERFIEKSSWGSARKQDAILADVASTDFLTAVTLLSRYNTNKSGGEAVSCKRKDVLKLNLKEYKKYADSLEQGFVDAAKFLKEQRIFTSRDLPYSTQLIPMAVFCTLLGNKIQDSTVSKKIARWFWSGILGEMYGGANETRYVNDVVGVMNWVEKDSTEPDTVARAYFNPTRLLSLKTRGSAAYKGIMALILKSGARDFITGRAMDFTVFTDENTDIHHIFPRGYCKSKYDSNKWDSIINKTPLFARTNRIIGGNAPSVYLQRIQDQKHVTRENLEIYVSSHQIDIDTLFADNFNAFVIARSKYLLKLIGTAMGKPTMNLDSDEIVNAFGEKLV